MRSLASPKLMSPPTAIVTGACSGIGLALTKYLLERKWNVMMADVNSPKEDLDNTRFIKCDVSSWDSQAAMFQQAYEWQGRLDFAALNAGIDDRDDIFNSISSDSTKPPRKPNMLTLDVSNELSIAIRDTYSSYNVCRSIYMDHIMALSSRPITCRSTAKQLGSPNPEAKSSSLQVPRVYIQSQCKNLMGRRVLRNLGTYEPRSFCYHVFCSILAV